MLRHRDPRQNAALRPDQWEAAARAIRLRTVARVATVLAILLGVAAYVWYPVDRTREMEPADVVEAAGNVILKAGGYRFSTDLSGESTLYPFPTVSMQGEYQRDPRVIRLEGKVNSGESHMALEYWLDGDSTYLLHPTSKLWLLLRDTTLDELASFTPENLAAPLIGGVRGVEVVGRETLPDGEALQLKLELDPDVMLPNMDNLRSDRAEYRLWVYTRTLRPARFTMSVAQRSGEDETQVSTRFVYQIAWEFGRVAPLVVPDAVKSTAQEATAAPPAPVLEPQVLEPKP